MSIYKTDDPRFGSRIQALGGLALKISCLGGGGGGGVGGCRGYWGM